MRATSGVAGWVMVFALLATGVLTACGETVTTTRSFPSPDCHAFYKEVATAPTVPDLRRQLLRVPRVRAVRIFRAQAQRGRIPVGLLSRRSRTVMGLDMWRLEDGRWTAQQYFACW